MQTFCKTNVSEKFRSLTNRGQLWQFTTLRRMQIKVRIRNAVKCRGVVWSFCKINCFDNLRQMKTAGRIWVLTGAQSIQIKLRAGNA